MTDARKVVLIALGVLLALTAIVGAALHRHIGGFIETVAREEEEAREREERESGPAGDENKDTGA